MPTAEESLEKYLTVEGPELRMAVQRAELASAGEQHFTTFSADAIDELADHMGLWVQSRLIREAQHLGDIPEAVYVTVRMSTDAQAESLEWRFDWQRGWLAQTSEGRLSRFSPRAMLAVRHKIRQWILEQLLLQQKITGSWVQAMELFVHATTYPPATRP